jgi:hypothetical protein
MAPDNPAGSTGVARDLTHLAQSVARFFCSMQLAHDAGPLTRLGSGRLRLDLRRRTAQHGLRWIPFPHIGDTLRHRISAALGDGDPGLGTLQRAELEADVKLTVIPRPAMPGTGLCWTGDDGPLVHYHAAIAVRLADGRGQWQAQLNGSTTWPESFGRKP